MIDGQNLLLDACAIVIKRYGHYPETRAISEDSQLN